MRQINGFMERQIRLINISDSVVEIERLSAMWAGFAAGLYLSHAISRDQHNMLIDRVQNIANKRIEGRN